MQQTAGSVVLRLIVSAADKHCMVTGGAEVRVFA